ncbi:MAG: hypothetical protein A2V86_14780 [Deltaproteobacteria bacterium RBG_16_49_23]|nr:MAG: hypothetical protein A2V86_14780 [Deltaproteobacteria bacterium RBG_16_49_23]
MFTTFLVVFFTALVSYAFGRAKTFLEAKQRAYVEILPIILKVAYTGKTEDQEEFNKAVAKLWIYGNRKVAKKADRVLSILVKPTRGDLTRALQEVIVEMRKDVQFIFIWQRLKPEEVNHIFMRITATQEQKGGDR